MLKQWNLNMDWRFRLGDEPCSRPLSHADAYQYAHAGSLGGVAGVNYDDSDWELVSLPHDYMADAAFDENQVRNHGYRVSENAFYRKRFLLPEAYIGKHLLLTFGGIAMTAKIYLNGSLLARSFSCYTPVEVDITDRAYFGDRVNTLVVQVDGHNLEGWYYEGNGIYRDVTLKVKEPLHIREGGCFIKPVKAEAGWQVDCTVEVENTAYYNTDTFGPVTARIDILDAEASVATGMTDTKPCPHDTTAVLTGSLRVTAPRLWDVDDPKLYTARVSLYGGNTLLDRQDHSIGFRTFTADPQHGFFLNGKPVKLKGTCNHQDHAGVGVAMPDALVEYRVKLLKELGCNTYRNAHNMATEALLDACDRQGMLLINENRHFECDPESLQQVRAMVRTARNHPCVIMYSMFNEEALQATREGQNIFRRQKNTVYSLDDSRFVTAAMGGGTRDPNGTALLMDVTGINYSLPYAPEELHRDYPDRVIFGSENCSVCATRGCYHTDRSQNTCANYDEDVVDWGQNLRMTLDFSRRTPWYGGVCIWTGFDYRGEPTPYSWPSVSSFFGLLDTCGFKKDVAYLVKSFFVEEPVLHLLPHWNHAPGQSVRVMTYSNCDAVELFLNGQSLGRQPNDCARPAQWTVDYAPGLLQAVGWKSGAAVAWDSVQTAGKPCRLIAQAQRQSIGNDGRDAVCVNCHAVDENGVFVPDADAMIHFEPLGDCLLLGVGNGDPNSHEPDHAHHRRLFAGRAQAVVGIKAGGKRAAVRVWSEGMEEASVTLAVEEVPMPDYLPSQQYRAVHGVTVSLRTYPERPDIHMAFSEFDMNSMENIVFDTYSLKPIFTSGWKLFKVPVTAPRQPENGRLCVCFQEVAASHVVVSVDGQVLLDQPHVKGAVTVDFPSTPGRQHTLRLLLKGTGGESGIRGGVLAKPM